MDWTAFWLTMRLSALTTAILFVAGVPLAHSLAMSRWRGKFLIEAVVALPIILPPTVLGFYLLMATGPATIVGRAIDSLTGNRLPFTFAGIVFASVVCNLPFAVRPFLAGFERVDRRLLEASWCLGASRWRTFWRVSLPLAWPGILAGLILSFAHTMGEFGVVLMVGGNIPGVTRTLSMVIFDDVQALNYEAARRTSAFLVSFALLILCLMQYLARGVGRPGALP